MVSSLLLSTAAPLGLLFLYILISSFGVPGELLWVLSAGALAADIPSLSIVIAIVAAGSIIGDFAAYELARGFSPWLSSKLVKLKAYRQHEPKARAMLEKSSFLLIFLTRFLFMAVSTAVSFISGFERIDRKKYLSAIIAGDILYAVIYATLGFTFKEAWNDLYSLIGNFMTAALLIAGAIVLVVIYLNSRNKRKK